MSSTLARLICVGLIAASVAACAQTRASGPAGVPSSTDVNPITGARGGTNR